MLKCHALVIKLSQFMSRVLRHVEQGSQGSDHQPSKCRTTAFPRTEAPTSSDYDKLLKLIQTGANDRHFPMSARNRVINRRRSLTGAETAV